MADYVLSDRDTPVSDTIPSKLTEKADLVGMVFGWLTVLSESDRRNGRRFWRCQCKCGNFSTVRGCFLRRGTTSTCGMKCGKKYKGERTRARNAINPPFSQERVPGYQSYQAAKKRVSYPDHPGYQNYGGRGITMCPRWFGSFMEFLKDMGPRPPGMTLERIDNDGPYDPDNCRWATRFEQCQNFRRNRKIKIGDRVLRTQQWSQISGNTPNLINERIRLGWDPEQAVFKPKRRFYGRGLSRVKTSEDT